MSSLEDGFGGGVDDMVSANTAELQIPFWEVGYHGFTGPGRVALPSCQCQCQWLTLVRNFAVPWRQIAMNGTERTVPEATPQLGFSTTRRESHGLYYDMHVAATTPSRSYVLHESRTFAFWWRITREERQPHSVSAYRQEVPQRFWA